MLFEFATSYRQEYDQFIDQEVSEPVTTEYEADDVNPEKILGSAVEILEYEGFRVESVPEILYTGAKGKNGEVYPVEEGYRIEIGEGTFECTVVETVTHEIGHILDLRTVYNMDKGRSEAFWRTFDLYFWDALKSDQKTEKYLDYVERKLDKESKLEGERVREIADSYRDNFLDKGVKESWLNHRRYLSTSGINFIV